MVSCSYRDAERLPCVECSLLPQRVISTTMSAVTCNKSRDLRRQKLDMMYCSPSYPTECTGTYCTVLVQYTSAHTSNKLHTGHNALHLRRLFKDSIPTVPSGYMVECALERGCTSINIASPEPQRRRRFCLVCLLVL